MNTSCQWQKWPRATKQWLTHRTKAGWCSTWGMTITRRPLASGFRIITWHWGILRPILVDFRVKCFNLGNLLSWLICFSSAKREEMIYCPHYIQAQLRTESVHSVTGPGQRTKTDCFKSRSVSQRWSQQSDGMCVLDLLRSSRRYVCSPAIYTSVPGLWFPFLLLLCLPWVHKLAVYVGLCFGLHICFFLHLALV